MCGCYDVGDFVCFLTFFITALVALLSVQYLVVFLDSFSAHSHGNLTYLFASFYFWLMTLLGCMVFAGITRRSIRLLRWPGRLLVFLLISGLITVTSFLWIVDRTHHTGVHDLEGKTIKLFIMLCVVVAYFVSIHKLILDFENPMMRAQSSPALGDESDRLTHPTIIQDFIKTRRKDTSKISKIVDEESSRPINVASDGINYYVVLLESSKKTGGESRFITKTTSRVYGKIDNSDADDEASCSSITEV